VTPGTGIAAALAINVGSAGAPILFNGAGGTPSSITLTNGTGLPTTGLTGTLQAAQEPAHTGDVTNSAGSLALAIVNNAVTLAKLATQATNTVLGNATSGTAVPTALSMTSCSAAGSAVNWTTNTGFGCNTSITANTVTTNANLTGPITSSGNATNIASQTGTGTKFVVDTSPTVVTPTFSAASNINVATFTNTQTSGIRIDNSNADSSSRNWTIVTNQVAFGDFAILTSTANGGDPRIGTSRFSIGAAGGIVLGGGTPTLAASEVGFSKITASGSAPGASTCKEAWVAGTNANTCKKIAYCGTSTTPTTIIDNVGAGC
jgi:hypothetical protein